jgi:pre-rRNA-processing protein TSR3
MKTFPPTCIIRHKRENLKKCSLRGLESNEGFLFYLYPHCAQGKQELPDLSNYMMLDLEGPPLTENDAHMGLVLVDATWRLAEKMVEQIRPLDHLPKRCLPKEFKTAYPRRQDDCKDPDAGLASIEALFISYLILKRDTTGLFDNYYWKDAFLQKNSAIIKNLKQ